MPVRRNTPNRRPRCMMSGLFRAGSEYKTRPSRRRPIYVRNIGWITPLANRLANVSGRADGRGRSCLSRMVSPIWMCFFMRRNVPVLFASCHKARCHRQPWHPATKAAQIQEPHDDPNATESDQSSPGGGLSRRPAAGSVSTVTKRLSAGSEQTANCSESGAPRTPVYREKSYQFDDDRPNYRDSDMDDTVHSLLRHDPLVRRHTASEPVHQANQMATATSDPGRHLPRRPDGGSPLRPTMGRRRVRLPPVS